MLVIVIKTVLFPLTEQIFSVPQNLPGCMTIPLPAVRLLIARKRTLKGSEVPPSFRLNLRWRTRLKLSSSIGLASHFKAAVVTSGKE